MNWRTIFAVVNKDLKVIRRTKAVMIPLIVVPLIVTIFMPALFAALPQVATAANVATNDPGLDQLLRAFPPAFQATIAAYDEAQRMVVLMAVYYFAPLYLLLPLMVSGVIAADSLAGEKERKTLEVLLYTPTSDRELLVAKLLSAWLPAIAVAWLGFLSYSIVLNTVAWPLFQRIFFPTPMWWLLALWVAPAVAGIGLGVSVLVSARVNTFQEAYQISGLVVLPIIALMISQGAGALYFGPGLVFLLGLGAWCIDSILLWLGARVLRRNALLTRL